MTLLVAVENIEDLQTTYKMLYRIIDPHYEAGASITGLSSTEETTLEALLYGCVLMSGADATSALADYVADGEVDLGFAKVPSAALARNLAGCKRAILFAATVGLEVDRLIARYSRLQPVKGLMFQAIGTERVEALCDAFCADMDCRMGGGLRRRFSPGYGDLPLELQNNIFRVLDCSKTIGLTLNGSLLMSPTKSVTAIAGIADAPEENHREEKCAGCDKPECMFRNL
jgi:hypothetical protein